MSLPLLLEQSPVCFVHLYGMGGKWLYSCLFVRCYFQDLFKASWCSSPLAFPPSTTAPTDGHTSVGQQAKTYIHLHCEDTGSRLVDLPGAMDRRDG